MVPVQFRLAFVSKSGQLSSGQGSFIYDGVYWFSVHLAQLSSDIEVCLIFFKKLFPLM